MIDPLNAKLIQFVSDLEKISQINQNLHRVISYKPRTGQPPDLFIFKVSDWVAVPVLDKSYSITSTLLRRLRTTLLESEQKLFAVTFPQYGLPSFTYNVPLTDEALREVEILSPFSVVLFSGDLDTGWLLLSIEADYYIMIGSPMFVDVFFEHKIEERFSQLCADVINNERESESLSQSHYSYSNFLYNQLRKYNNAEAGAELSLSSY